MPNPFSKEGDEREARLARVKAVAAQSKSPTTMDYLRHAARTTTAAAVPAVETVATIANLMQPVVNQWTGAITQGPAPRPEATIGGKLGAVAERMRSYASASPNAGEAELIGNFLPGPFDLAASIPLAAAVKGAKVAKKARSAWSLADDITDASAMENKADEFLYHVTTPAGAKRILSEGLKPGSKQSMARGFYSDYSQGKVFLTERGAVPYWRNTIERHLEHEGRKANTVILKIPREKAGKLAEDTVGNADASFRGKSYFSTAPVGSPPEPIRAYHGTHRRDVKTLKTSKAIETPGATFFTTNPDVADTFTLPREYGEPVFYDDAGREIKPGKVIRADLAPSNPYVVPKEDAQKFIDDTAFQTQVVKEARAAGHDAVVAKDVLEGIGERYKGDVYAILNDDVVSYPSRSSARKTSGKGE